MAFLAPAGVCGAKEFHVSPKGLDGAYGTAGAPFATPARARRAVRAWRRAHPKEPVTVVLHGGTYRLKEPLVFDAGDGGTKDVAVTWQAAEGATVTLSGGEILTGWNRVDGDRRVWCVPVPGLADGKRYPRHLWVNGKRATRARWPNAGADPPYVKITGGGIADDLEDFTLRFKPDVLKRWTNLADTEIVVLKLWSALRKRVASVDPQAGTVTLRPPHVYTSLSNRARKGMWAYFENSPDFLDAPGEWCLDRGSGMILYRPRGGEDMTEAEAVVPRLERLVVLAGTQEAPVRNLAFRGLTFAHTEWRLPEVGHDGRQAFFWYGGRAVPEEKAFPASALHWRWAEGCSLEGCTVTHTGATAVRMEEGCRRCEVAGCHVVDAAGNGVMAGVHRDPGQRPRGGSVTTGLPEPPRPPLPPEPPLPRDITITRCVVERCGAAFPGAVGVWVGFARDVAVTHNRIHDHPYTGISIGWRWDPKPTSAAGFTVAHNHIYECMQLVGDGGGIYSLGWIPGTVISENLIHAIRRNPHCIGAPNNGIFFDQGSKGFLIKDNVIFDTAADPVRFNQCKREWHEWEGNTLGETPSAERLEALKKTVGPGAGR
jgi:hypothetical protein